MTENEVQLPTSANLINLRARLLEGVTQSGECHIWVGCRLRSGYGTLSIGRQTWLAHRAAYILHHGPIPEGCVVHHTCYAPSCVNPAHLRAISQKENVEDRGRLNGNNTSGIRGVSWHKASNKWRAVVRHNGHQIQVGTYLTIEEASAAAAAKRQEVFTRNVMDMLDTPAKTLA